MAEQVSTTEDINDLYDSLTGTQKCAILMMLLGEDEAAEIMKNLSPKEVVPSSKTILFSLKITAALIFVTLPT